MSRKAVKKGFSFSLMVVGESGLGKSTLINSLLLQEIYRDRETVGAADRQTRTTQIEKRHIELDERGVKLRLTVVDTPGFNDAVNCSDCWKPIVDHIDSTFEQYFKDECGLNRKNIEDHRVHCCLYFISPYGHGLRPVDVELLQCLQHRVNLVPLIAKADTLTAAELRDLKTQVLADLDRHKICVYRPPVCDSDEEEEAKQQDSEIRASMPFAVIGSNVVYETAEGKKVRGRQYPWGVVEIDNPKHCDFAKLRLFVLRTHMQDLKDVTREVHYENYRAKYISQRMSRRQSERCGTAGILAGAGIKTKGDSSPCLEEVVTDSDHMLRQKEEELHRMQQLVSKMQEQLRSSTDGIVLNGTSSPIHG